MKKMPAPAPKIKGVKAEVLVAGRTRHGPARESSPRSKGKETGQGGAQPWHFVSLGPAPFPPLPRLTCNTCVRSLAPAIGVSFKAPTKFDSNWLFGRTWKWR
jgi:hypothetical protein